MSFRNHPKGLYTLFFTEMWERMSYYGMRGILVLFMTAAIADGGLEIDAKSASAIYGIYSSSVYLVALLGGWIADRLIGQQKAIFYGGLIITIGHFLLAFTLIETFYLGLLFVVLGTGLLKPNISAIVGGLYEKLPELRESGFTIFYMAINIGSILGFFICGFLGENIGWHYGFAAAGIGMFFGLIQFVLKKKSLNEVGLLPSTHLSKEKKKREINILILGFIIFLSVAFTGVMGLWTFEPITAAENLTLFILFIAVLYFIYLFLFGKLNEFEKRKIGLIIVLFFGAALFWSGFDQAGSSFNIFAKEYTDRIILGWEYPASWLQILNPALVVIFSPFIGFIFISVGASIAMEEGIASAKWLLLTYLFHTIGELTLSPIGLSAISKLSPKRFVGQMMGIWFLASALGAIIAGLLSGQATIEGLNTMPALFNKIAIISSISGLFLILISKPLHNWVFKKDL